MTARIDWARARRALDGLRALAKAHPSLVGGTDDENRKAWEETMKQDAQFVVRLPQDLSDRVDAYAERLRAEQPGPSWKRSDVVRLLLARALDAAEKSPKASAKK